MKYLGEDDEKASGRLAPERENRVFMKSQRGSERSTKVLEYAARCSSKDRGRVPWWARMTIDSHAYTIRL